MISFVQVNNPLAFGYYINKYPLHGIVLLLNYYLFHKQVFPNFRSYFYSVSYFPRLLLRKPMRIVYYLVRTKNPRWQASACSRADISKVFNAVTLFVARLLHFILHPIYCLLSILCKLVICSGKKINMETGFTIHNKQRDVILGQRKCTAGYVEQGYHREPPAPVACISPKTIPICHTLCKTASLKRLL